MTVDTARHEHEVEPTDRSVPEQAVGPQRSPAQLRLAHLRRPHTQTADPDTHLLLDLGIRLMLRPPVEVTTDLRHRVPQLRWPTRDEVVRAYNAETGLRRSKAVVEDRWVRMADYHRDLIAWVSMRLHRASTTRQQRIGAAEFVPGGEGYQQAVDLTTDVVERIVAEEAFPLWAVLSTLGASDPELSQFIHEAREADLRRWAAIADVHLAALGRSPQPGLTTTDIAELMESLSHGMAVRYLSAPGRYDHDPRRASALFARAATALMDALLAPAPTPVGVPRA